MVRVNGYWGIAPADAQGESALGESVNPMTRDRRTVLAFSWVPAKAGAISGLDGQPSQPALALSGLVAFDPFAQRH